jgi:dsRNA-specific ribonuclease
VPLSTQSSKALGQCGLAVLRSVSDSRGLAARRRVSWKPEPLVQSGSALVLVAHGLRLMSSSEPIKLDELEFELSLDLSDKELLRRALVHSSSLDEPRKSRRGSNEQLATLGDAVLDLVVASDIYHRSKATVAFVTSGIGDLTIERSRIVNDNQLSEIAKRAGLDRYMVLSDAQKRSSGTTPSMLAQAYEALVGAIFLDKGYNEASKFVRRCVTSLAST